VAVQFCEACGDKAPGKPAKVARVQVSPDGQNAFKLAVNGKEVDLAYTYFRRTKKDDFRNLARLAQCQADSSETLPAAN
jgi:hypothetical protein